MTTSQTSSATATREPLPLGVRLIGSLFALIGTLALLVSLLAFGAGLSGSAGPFGDLALSSGIFTLLGGSPLLVTGIGLLRRKNWARIVGIVIGVFSAPSIVGLLIAIYLARGATARHFTSN